jgi:hypothetical protein
MKKSTKTTRTGSASAPSGISADDLRRRWGQFSDRELAAIKTRRDLVRQVQAKFGLKREQAQTNVDVWAADRMFEADREATAR